MLGLAVAMSELPPGPLNGSTIMRRVSPSIRDLAATACVASVVIIAGCSSAPEGEAAPTALASTVTAAVSPTPEPSPEPPEPSPEPTFDQAGYLANLSRDPFLEKYSDDALLLLAEAACNAMPGAEDLQPARDAVGSIVTDPDSVNLVVWTALPMRCPEYEPLVEVDLGGVENPAAAPEGEPRDAYLSSLRTHPWYTPDLTDEMLVMQGQAICDGFTRGDSLDQTMVYFEPYPRDVAELAIESAVEYMCPEHADRLN